MKAIVRDHVYRIVDLGPDVTEDDDLDAAFSHYVSREHGSSEQDSFWSDLPDGWRFDFDADTTVEPYEGEAEAGGEA